MNNIQQLPDLGRYMKLMLLRDQLGQVTDNSILGFAIQNSLYTRPMDKNLLETIWDSYQDNKRATLSVVGEESILLIKEILNK